MNSGYVMIDCQGLDLIKGSTEQTITGIYARSQEAMKTGKAIVACNCTWDGKPVTPVPVFGIQFPDLIIFTSSTLQVNVSKTDVITITNMAA